MTRQWKPGDVAVVAGVGIAVYSDRGWATQTGNVTHDLVGARPVVVIDTEDPKQVDALTKAVVEACFVDGNTVCADNGIHPDTTARALRSLLTPPRPDEPTGLGAVVEDEGGEKWIRVAGPEVMPLPWAPHGKVSGATFWRKYADIAVTKVLSEGVR